MLASASAQDPRGSTATLTGELRSANAVSWGGLTVELESMIGGSVAETTGVRPDGAFEFRDIPPGTYRVSILDDRGFVIGRFLPKR